MNSFNVARTRRFHFPETRKALLAAMRGIIVLSTALSTATASRASTPTFTSLFSFSGNNGAFPDAGLTLSGSTLYGTTLQGGSHHDSGLSAGDGTMFSMPVTGGSLNWSVPFSGTTGWLPGAGPRLLLIGANLYGEANGGGGNNFGTVVRVPVTGGSVTVLSTLNITSGGNPSTNLVVSADGATLYGTTYISNTFGNGGVFSVPVGGGNPTSLAAFSGGVNGSNPLTRIGSTLYGTTQNGGAFGQGSVFSVPVTGGGLTTLCSFSGSNGSQPLGALTLVGSQLYGTTRTGGPANDGTVFSVPIGGGTPTTLLSFSGSNGANPVNGLTLSLSGTTFFGATFAGGGSNDGVIFSLPLTGGADTVMHSFVGTDGANPLCDLTLSADGGTLYGVTKYGGTANDGTVFAVTVPEPSTAALLLLGSAGIVSSRLLRRRRRTT